MIFVGITGHQNIPEIAVAFIERGVTDVVRRLQGEITGVSSLAAGSDQLFARIVLRMCGKLYAVIPCANYEASFIHPEDRRSFYELVNKADAVEALKHSEPSEEAFWDAGRRVVDLSQTLVAVWDGEASRGKGGTADVVKYARDGSIQIFIVWPPGLSR